MRCCYNQAMVPGVQSLVGLDLCGIAPPERVLVGVSGGADSLCLLGLLREAGYRCVAAHLDHQLRESSAADAQFVRDLAARWGLEAVIERQDVGAHARENRLSIEEAARHARYDFLFSAARRHDARAVAVGHTADDQVETLLMHLLRGAGLDGLRGMPACSLDHPWQPRLPLLRPLLEVWREETEAYCRERGLDYRTDESNADPQYFRNRLRLELVPYLEGYVPGVKQRLLQTTAILSADSQWLEQQTAEIWQRALRSQEPGIVSLDLGSLAAAGLAAQRRILRKAFHTLRPEQRDLDFQAVERAVAFLSAPPQSRAIEWPAGLRLLHRGDRVLIAPAGYEEHNPEWLSIAGDAEALLAVPGEVPLSSGKRITAAFADPEQCLASPLSAWLDASQLSLPLSVRARSPGDRFQPLGMEQGSQKISDFFINNGLPPAARDRWPLVFSAERVAWVPGYRPAHWARLRPDSGRAVRLDVVG